MKAVLTVVACSLCASVAFGAAESRGRDASLALVPYPRHLTEREGVFALPTNRIAKADVTWKTDAAITSEGYRLSVTPTGITAWSSDDAGAFYALQTLRQLVRPRGVPCCEIEDAPKFGWRGFMLDEARHFFGKETVKRHLDLMARVKLNVFHWHLTDDEGWRIELKRHPEVHEKGSVRPTETLWDWDREPPEWRGQAYGPYYYTQEDVKEIVAYAAERHIQVVPEIDFPAHSRALFVSHPEFTCRKDPKLFPHPWTTIGPQYECFCMANEDGLKFIEDILDEVGALFPSKFIHIGGDECPPDRWRECPACQKLLAELGLGKDDAGRLLPRLVRRLSAFMKPRGKEVIAWDEVFSSDLPDNLTIQQWHRVSDGRRAAEAGRPVIMSPGSYSYFQQPQGVPDDAFQYYEPEADTITTERAYLFNPLAKMSPAAVSRVRGIECCVWGEHTYNRFDLNWKTWPRAFATAEIAWSGPGFDTFEGFAARVEPLRRQLVKEHVNVAPITRGRLDLRPRD